MPVPCQFYRISAAIVTLFSVFSLAPVSAQDAALVARVDAVLAEWDAANKPGAAIAYIEQGEIVFKKAYGLANLEHNIPWSTATVSDLGSVSKQFTGMAFALLAEQGKLGLDDDIRLHLPQLPEFGETITIRHLFNHTSGLREIYNTLYLINRKPGDIIFQEDAQTLLRYQRKLQFSPGSRYLYNNTEYMLLADIVEAVTGEEFHLWMRDNIFLPLDMRDTEIMHEQGQVIANVASSYRQADDGRFLQVYDNSTLQGGGGIYSTVEDVSKWIANFVNHRVGTPHSFELLTTSGALNNGESLDYGLGIAVSEEQGSRQWKHSGSSAGYRSMLVYLPDYQRGYIFQTNTPAYGIPVDELNEALLGDVLSERGQPADSDQPESADTVALSNPGQFAGRYFSDELEVFYMVTQEYDELLFAHRWLGSFSMRYLGDDTFALVDLGGSIRFNRNDSDAVTGFELDNGRTIGVQFRRMP